MTSEEFDRIVTALFQMHTYNLPSGYHVSLPGVLKILHSNLHPDDKAAWEVGTAPNGTPMVNKRDPDNR